MAQDKIGLVLSGGGAKGAYQIGVWQGLRKLHIKYNLVTGTSVGALNGVFFTQNTYYRCLFSWLRVSYKTIFKDPRFPKNSPFLLVKKIITEKGLSPKGLETFFKKIYNEKKFYNSPIDYGLVTYNLSTLKPISLSKKEISKQLLKEYVLASATLFPAFKPKKIEKSIYIDGGYYDVLPINLAIKMGANNIIAVDLEGFGIKQKPIKDINIKYIKPTSELNSTLEFEPSKIRHTIRLGYLDTLKAYNKLDGQIYTFYNNGLNKINISNDIIDYLGKTFDLNIKRIYHLKTFNNKLIKAINRIEPIDINIKEISNLFESKHLIKYFYTHDIKYIPILKPFINEYQSALYLKEITKKTLS